MINKLFRLGLLFSILISTVSCQNSDSTVFKFKNYTGEFYILSSNDTLIKANVDKNNQDITLDWTEHKDLEPGLKMVYFSNDLYPTTLYLEKGEIKFDTSEKMVKVSSKTNDEIAAIKKKVEENPEILKIQYEIKDNISKKSYIDAKLNETQKEFGPESKEYKEVVENWVEVQNAIIKGRKDVKNLKTDILFKMKPDISLITYLYLNHYEVVYDEQTSEKTLEIAQTVEKQMPNEYTHYLVKGFNEMHQAEVKKGLIRVGKQFQDIIAPGVDGKEIKLSQVVKGHKIVLLKFWASWCSPCVRSIPETLDLTRKYSDEGFQVYAISLDDKESAWKNAIKKYKIEDWVNTSELKGWKGTQQDTYGVTGVPMEILISGEGKILGVNLTHDWLDKYVKEACEGKEDSKNNIS